MPELGKYGSVRGALSNGCLYRDWGEARVILLHQSDQFSLQGRKTLDSNRTQGSIHGLVVIA
jgi:hypothetical protein